MSGKSWFKLAKHFAILQSDKDTRDVIEIQKLVENWKAILEEIKNEIVEKENGLRKSIEKTRNDIIDLKKYLKKDTLLDLILSIFLIEKLILLLVMIGVI